MRVKALHAVTERRQRAKAGRSADFFFARTHSHLHLFELMLKMIQHDDGRSETKTTFKTRYRWYAGTSIPHGRKPAYWNITLQVVQLSIKAVERTLDKMAVLVLTKEDLIKWSVSGELNQ